MIDMIYEKLESNPCPVVSDRTLHAAGEEIFRELLPRMQIEFPLSESSLGILQPFIDNMNNQWGKPRNENVTLLPAGTFYDGMQKLATEAIDEFKIVLEASKSDVPSLHLNDKF